MPRPLLRPIEKQTTTSESRLSLSQNLEAHTASSTETKEEEIYRQERLLRKPRSKAYLALCRALDAGSHATFQKAADAMIGAIHEELVEVEPAVGALIGIVSKCYLGVPYEVHTITMDGGIVHHYKLGEPFPGRMEQVRHLAFSGRYAMIEVYETLCCAIDDNGRVSILRM